MSIPSPARARRRWWKAGAALTIGLIALLAAIPWGLGTGPGRRWVVARANRVLAPGRLELGSLGLSWFGPTRITGLVLRDARGDRVVVAPRATWDRSLGQLVTDRARYGVLVLDRATLDVERLPDGKVDLFETIKPILTKDPKTNLTIRFDRARLQFRGAGLSEPVAAARAGFVLAIPPAPRPLAWRLDLWTQAEAPEGPTLAIQGTYERWDVPPGVPPDLNVELTGRQWPWAIGSAGLASTGRLDGTLSVARSRGGWASRGRVTFGGLDATGPRLAGDHLRLDRVAGDWDVSSTADALVVRRLDLASPLATLKADGTLPAAPGKTARIEGTLDLAALARQIPRALRLREGIALDRGSARVRAEAKAEGDRQAWEVEAHVSDLRAHDARRAFTLHEPATLATWLVRRDGDWKVERFDVKTAFLDGSGRGSLDDGVAWTANLDLGGLRRQLDDLVDFGQVALAGRGALEGNYRRTGPAFEGRLSADLRDLQVGGQDLGTLRRDEVRLDLFVNGPASSEGWPRSWSDLRLGLRSGSVTADLKAAAREGASRWDLSARSPIVLADRTRHVQADLAARWDERGATIDELLVTLATEDNREESLRLAARGKFDRAKGELVLNSPPAGPKPGAIALGAEGLRVAGLGGAGGLRIEAGLVGDVEALARLAPAWAEAATADLSGAWSARATVRHADNGLRIGAKLDIPELSRPGADGSGRRSEGAVGVSVESLYHPDADRLDLAEIVLASRYATLEASGRLSELKGETLADLKGRLTPDWTAINGLLAERVEPGARVAGRPRDIRLQGALGGDTKDGRTKSTDVELGFDLTEAEFYGMKLGPTPIVLRSRDGKLVLDPIDTTLNAGRIHLEPELALDDEKGAAVRLGPESSVKDAEVNDAISHRVLSFVAPVLDDATRVRGRVSVALREAVFPLGGHSKRGTTVEGSVIFNDVEFVPGPLSDQLLALIGRDDRTRLKLDEPVALTIADRRVYQHGLALPLGKVTRIELEGWVDFDRHLALTASLPVTSAMVFNRPVLSGIVEGTRFQVPIRGTLQKPEIDRDAMNLALKYLGKTLLQRGAMQGIPELLQRLAQPRDPNAPPPLSREERRERRMERRAQRRGFIPPPGGLP